MKTTDKKIKDTREQIKQQENITQLKSLISRTPLKSDFNELKIEFSKSLDLSIEKAVNEHVEKNWNDKNISKDSSVDGNTMVDTTHYNTGAFEESGSPQDGTQIVRNGNYSNFGLF